MSANSTSRLAYIDWLRGLACVLMFQTHCYDAWLGGSARDSRFAMWSQLGGTFPAPLFLFLAGTSFALVTARLGQQGLARSQIAMKTIRRGAEVFALGILFRIQEFGIALGWAPWSDLFRVDILNTIGLSMMLMGVMCWLVNVMRERSAVNLASSSSLPLIAAALFVSAGISLTSPLLWTTWHPHFLPWEVETYINGVHNLGQPQAGLFPLFPWAGFAFAGLAFGFVLMSDVASKMGWRLFAIGGLVGVVFYYVAKFCDARSWQVYPVFDFWHTSPEFFLMRVGFLLLFVLGAYAWCRWGWGQIGFSPLIQLGNTSLLVYWVHIELVYGKFSILRHRSQNIAGASIGLGAIFVMMLALSRLRTTWKSRVELPFSWFGKRPVRPT